MTGETLRAAILDAAADDDEPRARYILDAFATAKTDLGEADQAGPDRCFDLPDAIARILHTTDTFPRRLRLAALAATAATSLYPVVGRSAAAGRLARLVGHRIGGALNLVEPAVALARHAGLPAYDDTPVARLREISLDVDTAELVALATLLGTSESAVARFTERCRAADCHGRPWEPPSADDPVARRRELAAAIGRDRQVPERTIAGGGVLIATIGIPASGKTTWIERHLGGELIISMDRMRAAVLGDANDQTMNAEIHRRSLLALGHALDAGRRVVYDATSYDRERRAMLGRIADRTGARVVLIYFDMPLDEALRRNALRGRKVPAEVIRTAYRRLEAPRPDEADDVLTISTAWPEVRWWRAGRDRWVWEGRPVADAREVV